jgi:hypothetical protein
VPTSLGTNGINSVVRSSSDKSSFHERMNAPMTGRRIQDDRTTLAGDVGHRFHGAHFAIRIMRAFVELRDAGKALGIERTRRSAC